jgi:spermidine synthase
VGLLSYLSAIPIAHSSSLYNKSINVIERFGKRELYVNGIQQSGPYTIRLWKNGLDYVFNYPPKKVEHILILGIGGGTVFPMLYKRFPSAKITAVDIDQEIISLYTKYFSGDTSQYVSLICADARKFVISKKRNFDLIFIDLYIGNDVPDFVTGKPFLTTVKNLVSSQGMIVFNYFTDKNQQEKSQIFFDTLSGIYRSVVRKQNIRNVFYYCGKIG